MTRCKACAREGAAESVYCERHLAAYTSLEEAYPKWRTALGVTWVEYLKKVSKVSGTGAWVKEVIQGNSIVGGNIPSPISLIIANKIMDFCLSRIRAF